MYDVAFLGCMFPPEQEKTIRANSKSNIQNAANLLQWDYVTGLEKAFGCPIRLITRMAIGSYPQGYRKPFIKSLAFSHADGADDISVGFINVYPIRQLFYARVANGALKQWAQTDRGGKKVLFVYSYSFSDAILYLKTICPAVHICWILLDMPSFTNLNRQGSRLYQIKHNMENLKMKKVLQMVDSLVPITSFMRDTLDPEHKLPAVIIEGMVKPRELPPRTNDGLFTFAYTGTLTIAYGILEMIQAFTSLEGAHLRLVICGNGEAAPQIKEYAEKDNRIDFRGAVSPEEAFQVQHRANVLVNPRRNEGEYTKYSFPSKTLQYMSAGRPVLCYRLDGIPQEYENYLVYVEEEDLRSAFLRVLNTPAQKLDEIGKNAYQFVCREKSCEAQTRRLVNEILDV